MRAQRLSLLKTRLFLLAAPALLLPMLYAAPLAAAEPRMLVALVSPEEEQPALLTDSNDGSLQSGDLALYRAIFGLQDRGEWQHADRLIDRLHNRLLLGHLQAQRYLHPTAYVSTYGELARWLDSYGDLPQAARIYKLAVKRRPAGAQGPMAPLSTPVSHDTEWPRATVTWHRLDGVQLASHSLDQNVLESLPTEIAAPAASGDEAILRAAGARWEKNGALRLQDSWAAGLAAWRLGQYPIAAKHFAAVANAEDASGEDVASGAFWAARSWVMVGRPALVQRLLHVAASASDGFYGSIAKALVGEGSNLDWSSHATSDTPDPELLGFPAARRAVALAQMGESELASQELSLLAGRVRPQLAADILAMSAELSLPAAELRADALLRRKGGRQQASAMFPAPSWQPTGGFTVDRALLWAIARTESGFDAEAVSPKGAMGLMQIMPKTAASVANKLKIPYKGEQSLLHPETNLRIGQAYIQKLRRLRPVGDSLIHLCLAYNAGISRVESWMRAMPELGADPLLFLESVPLKEPRQYVKAVMVNLWAYRARLGQPMPSLRQLAANEWPAFEAIEAHSRKVVDRARKS